MRVDNLDADSSRAAVRRNRQLENGTPMNNSSIGRSGLRVHSGGKITIEDAGGLSITGTAEVIGQLIGSGILAWMGDAAFTGDVDMIGTVTISGPLNIIGPVDITDDLDITGNTTISGTTSLQDDLTLTGGGKIKAGALTLDPALHGGTVAFSSGGYMNGASGIRMVGPGGSTIIYATSSVAGLQAGGVSIEANTTRAETTGNFHVGGISSASGAKTFRINHPTKPGRLLLHGSTESPVSGIEYWGEGELDAGGNGEVVLPDYFDALAKPEGRMALVTGRGFAADWSDIDVDTFTIAGKPSGKYSWLVKAERIGGDFTVEPLGEEEPYSNSGQ